MPKGKKSPTREAEDRSYGIHYETLQVPKAIKDVLEDEKLARIQGGERSRNVSYGRLLAELIVAAWDNPKYKKILKEAGLID